MIASIKFTCSSQMMNSWADRELKSADLGARRLNKRLVKIVSDLSEQPNATVPQACGDWAATQATYDFWAYPHVLAEAIRDCHQQSTVERVKKHKIALSIQDTTEANYTHHPSKTGMGHTDSRTSRGLKIHSVNSASTDGVPLGILHQQVWARDISTIEKKHSRHKKETKDKESQKWLSALSATEAAIPEDVTIVTVADCEADIYDFLAMERRENGFNSRLSEPFCQIS